MQQINKEKKDEKLNKKQISLMANFESGVQWSVLCCIHTLIIACISLVCFLHVFCFRCWDVDNMDTIIPLFLKYAFIYNCSKRLVY